MGNKKKSPFIQMLFVNLWNSIVWVLLVLIPAGIQIYQFFGGSVKMLGNIPQWIWFAPLVTYIVCVLGKTTYDYRKEKRDLLIEDQTNKGNAIPVIHARPPKIQIKRIDRDKDRYVVALEILNIVPGTTAEKVLPIVTWFTTSGRRETENNGRWWLSSDDQKRMKDSEKLAIDLLSNGTEYLFHFARTSQDPKFFYAYFREKDGKDGYCKLHNSAYRVRIHFQSNNGAVVEFFYNIRHDNGELFADEVKK